MARFALNLSRLISRANGSTETAVRRVMLEAFSSVIQMSPVDTGRFRGNWVLGFGSPRLVTIDKFDRSGSATIVEVASGVSTAPVNGPSVFLTNSLPYAQRLEYGYSAQAPQGMVRVTLARITAKYGV